MDPRPIRRGRNIADRVGNERLNLGITFGVCTTGDGNDGTGCAANSSNAFRIGCNFS